MSRIFCPILFSKQLYSIKISHNTPVLYPTNFCSLFKRSLIWWLALSLPSYRTDIFTASIAKMYCKKMAKNLAPHPTNPGIRSCIPDTRCFFQHTNYNFQAPVPSFSNSNLKGRFTINVIFQQQACALKMRLKCQVSYYCNGPIFKNWCPQYANFFCQ